MIIFLCVFKAFGEILHTHKKRTRLDYNLCCHIVPVDVGNATNLGYFWPCPLSSEDISVKPAFRCEIKGKLCLSVHPQCAPQASPTVQMSHVCFDFSIIFLYFYMYSVIDLC